MSVLLFVVLGAAYMASSSKLALAQAADSLSDVLTAGALWWALRTSVEPPDEDHPFGHYSAEPVAALIVAVLAGVLAVAVVREAIDDLIHRDPVTLSWWLAVAIAAKVVAKAAIVRLSANRSRRSSVVDALRVDARNDVLLGLASLGGFIAARFGSTAVDAWLAIPVAGWIGVSAVQLGLENTRLLMGAAPPRQRIDQLSGVAASVTGVERIEAIRARHHGNRIHVWVEVRVRAELTIGAAHDIGERVEARLLEESDVCDAVVHVDAA